MIGLMLCLVRTRWRVVVVFWSVVVVDVVKQHSIGFHAIQPPFLRLPCRPLSEVGGPSSEKHSHGRGRLANSKADKLSVGDEYPVNEGGLVNLIDGTNQREARRRKMEKKDSQDRARRLSSSSPKPRTAKQPADGRLSLPSKQPPFERTAEVPPEVKIVCTPKRLTERGRSSTPNARRVQDAPARSDTASPPSSQEAVAGFAAEFMYPDSPPPLNNTARTRASLVAKPARPGAPLGRTLARSRTKAGAGMPPVPNSRSAEGKDLKGGGGAQRATVGGSVWSSSPGVQHSSCVLNVPYSSSGGGRRADSPVGRQKKSPSREDMESSSPGWTLEDSSPRKAPGRTPSPATKGGRSSTASGQPRRANSPSAVGGRRKVTRMAGMSPKGNADIPYSSTLTDAKKDHRTYDWNGEWLAVADGHDVGGEERWVFLRQPP